MIGSKTYKLMKPLKQFMNFVNVVVEASDDPLSFVCERSYATDGKDPFWIFENVLLL